MSVQLAPSILAADFVRLADDIARVEAAGADLLHVDVMDGHFVPNITIGPPVVAAIHGVARVPLDVHLMIEDPDRYLEVFAAAGGWTLTVHIEACQDAASTLARIRSLGVRAGLAVSPDTPIDAITPLATALDHLLVMSVYPGFTGQAFLPGSTTRVAEARALLTSLGVNPSIGVDGGVGVGNAGALAAAGATVLVAGAAIFHAPDCALALRQLRESADRR